MVGSGELDPEDAKIVTLARSARLRAYAPHTGRAEGAAVRDIDGRTYAAATVEHVDPALTTSALRAAVVAAAASGARAFEAAALVTEAAEVSDRDLAVLREFGAEVPVLIAGPDGTVRTTVRS
jgi:cytidine deaminase